MAQEIKQLYGLGELIEEILVLVEFICTGFHRMSILQSVQHEDGPSAPRFLNTPLEKRTC